MAFLSPTHRQHLQNKIDAFQELLNDHLETDPERVRIFLTRKVNEMRTSSHETQFVTFAAVANLIAAIFELIVGLWMKSVSVVSAAIDSLLDFVLGLFNLYLLNESQKEEDDFYNYGYGKLQWFGALLQGVIILFFGITLIYFSVQKLIHASPVQGLGLLMTVMIIDLIGGLASIGFYYRRVKHTTNMIVEGTLKKVYAWLLFNIGILIGLIVMYIGKHYYEANRYFIDPIIGLLVAVYVLITAGQLLYEAYGMLMDKALPEEDITHIKHVIGQYRGKFSRRSDLSTRHSWTTKFIEFNLYFDSTTTSFNKIYAVCLVIKEHLEQEIPHSSVNIRPFPEK